MTASSAVSSRVGFVGLGSMGRPMAANLVRGGFDVLAWRRARHGVLEVDGLGIPEAETLEELGATCATVVLCLSDGPDVEEVVFAPQGLASSLRTGSLVIDCSTIAPDTAESVAQRLSAQGVEFVDAPVTGGTEGAARGTLSILVGGVDEVVERARGVLAQMGTTITHVGAVGAGQRAKAVNQVILAGMYLGVAEGVVLALKSGLEPRQLIAAMSPGAAGSWVLSNRAERMIDDEYPLGFKLSLHRKDLGIALELAAGAGASLPVAALAASLEDGLIAQGHGDDDNSALARAIRGLSGL